MAVLALVSVTACDGDSSTTGSAANNTTTQKTTATKETTETEKAYEMSKSTAISIATERIKQEYANYYPVVIGETKTEEYPRYWEVYVKGHYWKKSEYGNKSKQENFNRIVKVYKDETY